ncbi:hypothetical protein [Pseudomonas sp.]|uniref:hypothetical protein n=1 Tax=Pseudomonas sp. TaxID=306 RepID=UPI0028B20447|nr:hypothetical protein [Pseudomonas sp.]
MLEFEWLTALCSVALSAVCGHSGAENRSRQLGLKVNDCSKNQDNRDDQENGASRSLSALESNSTRLIDRARASINEK